MEDSQNEEDCCLNNGRRTGRRRIGKLNLGKSTNNTKPETGIVISTSQIGPKQETLPGAHKGEDYHQLDPEETPGTLPGAPTGEQTKRQPGKGSENTLVALE